MKVFLREITDQETELDLTQNDKWVADAVVRVDETLEGEPAHGAASPPRKVNAHLSLRRVDEVVVINGRIRTQLRLVCSRCAAYYLYPTEPRFSALFCKDPVMAGVGHLEQTDEGETHAAGRNKGFARHAHDESLDGDSSESTKDIDITYINEDFIDLSDVLTEQLRLEIPFQPLCKEECKGMCAQCGADWNTGRCACAKLTKSNPFSVLKDLKAQH
jgi:uncharacterized protein